MPPPAAARQKPSIDPSRPSFQYKLFEQRRIVDQLMAQRGLKEPVNAANGKHGGRAFAERHGVAVPALLHDRIAVDELDFDALPDRFVAKPIQGAASRGVFPLHRVGPDRYRSLLDGDAVLSSAELLERYERWIADGKINRSVIVEQLIHEGPPEQPRLPIDWRFFCFYGEVGFVMARDQGGMRDGSRFTFRFFDGGWTDLGVVRQDIAYDFDMALPRRADEMIEISERLSAAIPRGFIRIDLFDGDDGVYFGEVTPFPGGKFDLPPEHDQRFGEQWERALARLEAEAIDSGLRSLRGEP